MFIRLPALAFSEGVGGLLGVVEHEMHSFYQALHLIILFHQKALAKFLFKLSIVLEGTSTSGMDDYAIRNCISYALKKVMLLNVVDEFFDFVGLEAFQENLVAIGELYCIDKKYQYVMLYEAEINIK